MPAPKDPKKRKLWIERIGASQKGQRRSPETEFKKGQIPWNKGKLLPEMSGKNHPMYGKHHSEATKEKMARTQFQPGQIPWNAGTKGMGIMKVNKTSFKKGDVAYWKGKHLSREHVRRILTRRTPSSLEEKFQSIIKKYSLPYKFVGDGSFFIEQFNPDFINTNSQKIAIEVYASFHKIHNHNSIVKWKQERAKIFGNYGWRLVYFDETQVNKDYILSTLKEKDHG